MDVRGDVEGLDVKAGAAVAGGVKGEVYSICSGLERTICWTDFYAKNSGKGAMILWIAYNWLLGFQNTADDGCD